MDDRTDYLFRKEIDEKNEEIEKLKVKNIQLRTLLNEVLNTKEVSIDLVQRIRHNIMWKIPHSKRG